MMILLRDPVWQFIGVIVALCSLIISIIPIFKRPGGQPGERIPFIPPDSGLDCLGWPVLFAFWWVSAYALYLLVARTILLDHADEHGFLFWALLVGILFGIIILTWAKHSQLALILLIHFCAICGITALTLIGLKTAVTLDRDFTMVKQIIDWFQIGSPPWNLHAIPADISVHDPSEARYIFVWSYILSFLLVLAVYGGTKRTLGQRHAAGEYLGARERRQKLEELEIEEKKIVIELKQKEKEERELAFQMQNEEVQSRQRERELEIQEKELAVAVRQKEEEEKGLVIQMREHERDLMQLELERTRLELEKARIEYTLELANNMVDSLHTDMQAAMRVELMKISAAMLLHLGSQNGSDVLTRYLYRIGERSEKGIPVADPITKP